MKRLDVIYDDGCSFCRRCVRWLGREPQVIELRFLPANSVDTAARYPGLTGLGEEITAVDDAGGVYRGTDAYLVCLYALRRWRAWSFRLSSPGWRPLARRAFALLSSKRGSLSKLVGAGPLEDPCAGACPPTSPPTSVGAPVGAKIGAQMRQIRAAGRPAQDAGSPADRA